jgi:hypothetical protein
MGTLVVLVGRLLLGVDRLGGRCQCGCCASRPHQDFALLIHCELSGVDKFGFQIIDVVVIQIELPLESPVGHPSMALQQRDHLFQHFVKGHGRPSTHASPASAWGSQKVMSMA